MLERQQIRSELNAFGRPSCRLVIGYGQQYAPEHYVDTWAAVTQPPGWTPATLAQRKQHLAQRIEAEAKKRN